MEVIAEEIRQRGATEDQIIFIDLDSKANRKVKIADQLEVLIDEKSSFAGLKYLFIDEVQNVEGFEDVLNAYRTEGGYSIFITGSNSYLLSGELVTKLTGRYLEFEIFTLTFDEYVGMKSFYGKPVSPNLAVELNSYILEGGFPRTIFLDDLAAKRVYSQGVVQEIFAKDIVRRVKIKDVDAFSRIRDFVVNNFGATFSINSLQGALTKAGLVIGRTTIARYIKILVDAKILYECRRFDMKSKRALSGEVKYYLADLSFYYALNTDNRINYGSNLENMVYFYARSLDYAVSVGRIGQLECDFILRDGEQGYAYVQVAYTIGASRETEDREYRSLEKIEDNYPKYVMTTDYLLQKRNGIHHVNLMDFMLAKKEF